MPRLYEKLKEYSKSDVCPMHMPGHKRKEGICREIDITEIDGFDNLAKPEGIIKDLQDGWSKVYGAKEAYISVNGSTCAVLSAICGICKRGDRVIMARNCHKSVYNAAELMGLDCSYIFPEYDEAGIAKGITREMAENAIKENPDASLIILTSPTYEGVLSDVKGICEASHKSGIPVFVDAAHGAHLEFMNMKNPIKEGADAVAVSLHKTLPAMTQTALLLLNGGRTDFAKIKEKLNVFQTSSPSYVLMASVDECLDFVQNKRERFLTYAKLLESFYNETKTLKHLEIRSHDDQGKIVISTHKSDISGKALMEIMRNEFKIELEMAYDSYAVAMTSVCDTEADFIRLKTALFEIDKKVKEGRGKAIKYPRPQKSGKREITETEFIPIDSAEGRICADYIWAYPPGVPIIAPYEILDKETVSYLKGLEETELIGTKGSTREKILTLKREA